MEFGSKGTRVYGLMVLGFGDLGVLGVQGLRCLGLGWGWVERD